MLRTQPQSVSGAFHSSIIFAARESLSARFLLRGLYKQMQKSALATAASLRSMTSHGVSRVGERHDREVVGKRGAEHRRPALSRGGPGDNFHVYIGVVLRKLQHGARHAVHARVAAAHERHGFSTLRAGKRKAAPFDLVHHRRREMRRVGHGGEREFHVFRVTHNDVGRLERTSSRNRHAVGAARADSHHEELSHHRSLNESLIVALENATVTPP